MDLNAVNSRQDQCDSHSWRVKYIQSKQMTPQRPTLCLSADATGERVEEEEEEKRDSGVGMDGGGRDCRM